MLAGVHPGCFELFANERVRHVSDLKGKNVGMPALGSSQHLFLASIAAYVGLDPAKDIDWVTSTSPKPIELFADGKIDAFLGFPPEPQELRARKIGTGRPEQRPRPAVVAVFLLHAGGQPDFVREHPVATKRVLRAMLKAADLCAAEPERVAQRLVDGGFTASYDYALQTLDELPYANGASTTPRTRPVLRAPPA